MGDTEMRSAREVLRRVKEEPDLASKIKLDPVGGLEDLVNDVVKNMPALETDVWIYRIVVGSLGTVVLLTVIGAISLAVDKVAIPDVLTAIGSAAVGALAGLIAPIGSRK